MFSIPFMYNDCSDTKPSTIVKETAFYFATNLSKTIKQTTNSELNIISPLKNVTNSNISIVTANVTKNSFITKNNDVSATITTSPQPKQFLMGKVFKGIPYYAVHLSIKKDILNSNFIADIHSIKLEERNYKISNVYSYNTHSIVCHSNNNIILSSSTNHFKKSNINIENSILEHKDEVIQINKVEKTFNKTNNVSVLSDFKHNTNNQILSANILHNNISLKGYINGEYVLPVNDMYKDYTLKISEGWNIINAPIIINDKPSHVLDFINKTADLLGKKSYDVFEVAMLIENNKEKTFIVSKDYITDSSSINNFPLYKTNNHKTVYIPFMIKSKIDFQLNTKDFK